MGLSRTDGYAGYGFLDTTDGIEPMGCWAHVRRKFHDVIKALGTSQKGERKQGHADQALKYIRELYGIEKNAKEQNLTGAELISVRREKAKPILDEFETWLTHRKEDVPPKSLLGKAVIYASNQWKRLGTYIEHANVTLDNNMAENTIRPLSSAVRTGFSMPLQKALPQVPPCTVSLKQPKPTGLSPIGISGMSLRNCRMP